MRKLLLMSGGMDSTLIVHTDPDIALCLGINYGQPHVAELQKAEETCRKLGVPFRVLTLPTMPKVDDVVFAGRNAVLLAVAASVAQAGGLDAVVIGCNKADYGRFPDCREGFIDGMSEALTAYGVGIEAPLRNKSKREIIDEIKALGVSADETLTCYAPINGVACGTCYSCKGLDDAKVQG